MTAIIRWFPFRRRPATRTILTPSTRRCARGLALPQASLNSINTSKGDEYGLHPGLVELANLYNTKKNVAVLTNVGSLVTPLTQSDYLTQTKAIPLNLFSHLDQQTELQTSVAQGFAATGWGGRLADAMQGCNSTGFPTIVSVGGNALFATGSADQSGHRHGGAGSRAARILDQRGFAGATDGSTEPVELRQRTDAGAGFECHRLERSQPSHCAE